MLFTYYSNKKYFTSYRSYWSKGWPFSSDNFSSLMSSRRFELILRFLHLNDSATQPQRGQQGFNKLYKIQPLLDLLLPSFKDCYTPSQFVSIDESMIAFKGRLSFLQYLPNKPHKWGMKAWVVNISLIYLISFMLGDQLVLYYGFSHRSVKWWKRCFFHLLDLSLVNSHILYKAVTSSRITQLDFRLSVAKSLLEGLERPRQRHHEPSLQLPVRLTERASPSPSHSWREESRLKSL